MRKVFSGCLERISLEKEAVAALLFNLAHLTNSFKQWRIVVSCMGSHSHRKSVLLQSSHHAVRTMESQKHQKWDDTARCYRARAALSCHLRGSMDRADMLVSAVRTCLLAALNRQRGAN